MMKRIIPLVSLLLIVTNFEWFLGIIFEVYETIDSVFNSYPPEYQVIGLLAAILYLLVVVLRIEN